MMNLLRSKTFCVFPWIGKMKNLDGTTHICCYSDIEINSKELDSLRIKILNQEKIPHCETCYKLDEQKVISPRLIESSRWLKDDQVKFYIENWEPGTPEQIFYYDLRYDNKCNLACISCNPHYSSLWAKELGIKIKKQKSLIDVQDIITSKKVYMIGGEPLIIDEYIKLLSIISKLDQQPEIVINTNLTRVNESMREILQRIKNLTVIVSVDSWGQANEYHRWPMKWQKFINNLNWARDVGCTIQFNTVIDAVTVLHASNLVDIESYCDLWTLTVLEGPAPLLVNNLDESAKKIAKEHWKKIYTSRFFKTDISFKKRVDQVFSLLDMPGDSKLLANYIDTIDRRRNINHQDFLGIKLS